MSKHNVLESLWSKSMRKKNESLNYERSHSAQSLWVSNIAQRQKTSFFLLYSEPAGITKEQHWIRWFLSWHLEEGHGSCHFFSPWVAGLKTSALYSGLLILDYNPVLGWHWVQSECWVRDRGLKEEGARYQCSTFKIRNKPKMTAFTTSIHHCTGGPDILEAVAK